MNTLEKKILYKKQTQKCASCNIVKNKDIYKIITTKKTVYRYQDEFGKRWNGKRCQPCYEEHRRLSGHIKGTKKPRSMCEYVTIKKAYYTENLVKLFLESAGLKVKHTIGSGPDIIVNDDATINIEVKSAIKFDKYYKISKIKKNRENDDIMAIVLPDESIHFEPMKNWVKKSVMLTDVIKYNKENRFIFNNITVSFRHF